MTAADYLSSLHSLGTISQDPLKWNLNSELGRQGKAARSEKILMSGFSGAHILAAVTELKVFQRKPNHRPQGGSTQQYFPGLKLAGAP